MINPANYYNQFSKYNYVIKNRSVYIPRNTEPLVKSSENAEKSASIYSDNYDAETDVMESLKQYDSKNQGVLANFINKLFG